MSKLSPEEYIYSFAMFGKGKGYKPGLERMDYMLKQVGSPHTDLSVIHVGGSNGKGSTVAFLDSILREAGYTVGRFTSPHLHHFGERIAIDTKPLPPLDLHNLIQELSPIIEEVEKKTNLGRPTFFEVTTFLALYYFARQGVDLVVLEVGMGGRRDATNIVQPLVTAITNIDLEHTQYLGDTVEKIAWEKAGIIKKGVPVITGAGYAPLQVIQNVADEVQAPLYSLHHCYTWHTVEKDLHGQSFHLQTPWGELPDLTIKMPGSHQVENAALAVALAQHLPAPYSITNDAMRRGLEKGFWPGRLEILSDSPLIILDGAHNLAGFQTLCTFLQEHLDTHTITFVLTFSGNKDIEPILDLLNPLSSSIILTDNSSFRAADSHALKEDLGEKGRNIQVIPQISSALSAGIAQAGSQGVVCFSGSLYGIADARAFLREKTCAKKA